MALSEDELLQVLRKLTHDLRGPLINVRMTLEVLVALDQPEERQSVGREVDQELARLDRLIDLTSALAQAGNCQLVDLRLASVVAQFLQNLPEHPGIEVEHSLETDDARGLVDSDKLLRVLAMLFEEAQPGGDKVFLSLRVHEGACEIRLEDSRSPIQETLAAPKLSLSEAFFRLVMEGHRATMRREHSSRLGGQAVVLTLPVVSQ